MISMYLFWKVSCIQHIKLVQHKLMYGKDQLNLESYIHTTILRCAEKDTFKSKFIAVLQKKESMFSSTTKSFSITRVSLEALA